MNAPISDTSHTKIPLARLACLCFDKLDRKVVTHRHNFEIRNELVVKRSALLSWKVVNRYKFSTSYA